MKNTFIVSCPIDTYSGYGARARDYVKSIIESDKYEVKILSQRWGNTSTKFIKDHEEEWGFLAKHIIPQLTEQPDYWCQITVPNEFQAVGKYNIGLTAGIETTVCDGSWIEGCNRMDLILTSSNHSKRVFETCEFLKDGKEDQVIKLNKPIKVLFEGANLDVYKKVSKFTNEGLFNHINDIPEEYAYLFVGHWMQGELGHDRKNVGLLVKTFYETFKDIKIKPALILKTSVVGGSHIDKAEIMRRISMIRETIPSNDLPPIYLIHGSLSDAEMNEVYNHPKVKTMVCLTRGEGFGRPLLEFSLIGKPIITTGWSGHTDFLNEGDIGYVGGELEELHPSSQVKDMLLKESKWFKPNLGDVKYLFNDTFKNHGDWVIKAKRQVKISKDRFSYDAMSKKINEIFDVTLPILPKKMELKLPGMDKIKMPKKIKQLKKV
jgi:glycosyltransferase involved in cell wall biosynthesis|tara:strand:+ start:275 stop:1576 length:1302 start_codon:yes stop_codon:yes gene_type:complete